VIAYGKIIPKKFIELPSLGTYNLHFSLLPKYRGAAPVQHALLNGDRTSGISIFALEEKLDTGPVFVQEKMELDEKNAAEVFSEMKDLSIPLLRKFCTELSTGKKFIPQKQDEKAATFAPKIQKEAGQIFPSKETSEEILCKYRAFFLWPQIFFVDEKTGLRIKLFGLKKTTETVILPEINSPFVHFKEKYFLSAADDLLEFEKAQPEGKKPLSGIEFWNFWKQRG
jgi:methionyl-tRNA formyltransferase